MESGDREDDQSRASNNESIERAFAELWLLADLWQSPSFLNREHSNAFGIAAAERETSPIVSMLVATPDELDGAAHRGWTLLTEACGKGAESLAIRILELGANPNLGMPDQRDGTPLKLAAMVGSVRVVRALIDAGADPDFDRTFRESRWPTPLMLAAERATEPHVEIIRALLDAGADPTYRAGRNYSAIQAIEILAPGPKAQECRDLMIEAVRKREAENPRRRRRLIRSRGGSKDDWRASIHRFYRWQEYRQGRWDIIAAECAPAKLAELAGVDAQHIRPDGFAPHSVRDKRPLVFLQIKGSAWSFTACRPLEEEVRIPSRWPSGKLLSSRGSCRVAVFQGMDEGGNWDLWSGGTELQSVSYDSATNPEVRTMIARVDQSGLRIPPNEIEDDGLNVQLMLQGVKAADVEATAIAFVDLT